jgi:hypothetical protein
MEIFKVKILQTRRRLGIKEITAPSIEVAESSITEILKQHFNLETISEKVLYLNRTPFERKLKLKISGFHFSVSILHECYF